MIPKKLILSGFTSYRKAVELDFTQFNLACISGLNGAGKSSILDGITYALYGKARKTDDQLINAACDKAEATLDFEYEGQIYRVIRSITRGKGSNLDFFIYNPNATDQELSWKTLTEHTIRETDAKIERTLRLDYETFVNASFFLQGKADSFATQRPADRKRILSSILGLNQWDAYLEACRARSREVRLDMEIINSKLAEIQSELDQETERKEKLKGLETTLKLAIMESAQLQAQLDTIRILREKLNDKRQHVNLLRKNFESAENKYTNTLQRRNTRQKQLNDYNDILKLAPQTEAAYQAWQKARQELEAFDKVYEQFKPIDSKHQDLLKQIDLKRQSLQQDLKHLQNEQQELEETLKKSTVYQSQHDELTQKINHLEEELAQSETLQEEIAGLIAKKSALTSENTALNQKMLELKERQTQVAKVQGAQCPFCDQELSPQHRQNLIDKLELEGKALADQWRSNKQKFDDASQTLEDKNRALERQKQNQTSVQSHIREKDRLSQILAQIESQRQSFELERAPKMAALKRELEEESYLPDVRAEMELIKKDLARLGYDTEAHTEIRRKEAQARDAEKAYHELGKARSSVEQIRLNLAELETELINEEKERDSHEEAFKKAAAELAAEETGIPDQRTLEQAYYSQKEAENKLQREVGAARQLLDNLDTQRLRQAELREELDALKHKQGHLRSLEIAFGKDGVPAMLIEQALPELEAQANEILLKLSDNTMSITFSTQREYKDKKRDDKRETLDIIISDGASTRDYETYSGGEAFRINFAIRLALSRVLSMRAGARLQTLVIDEGFGNQDARGRQLLIEAINMIQDDFEKILVITHIEELKDQFPNRVEVYKDADGSSNVQVALG